MFSPKGFVFYQGNFKKGLCFDESVFLEFLYNNKKYLNFLAQVDNYIIIIINKNNFQFKNIKTIMNFANSLINCYHCNLLLIVNR